MIDGMRSPTRLRLSTLDGFASALLLALGAAPHVGCGGGVEVEDGSGGAGGASSASGTGTTNASATNAASTGNTAASTGDTNPMTSGTGPSTGTGEGTTVGPVGSNATTTGAGGTGGGTGGCTNPTPLIVEGVDTGIDTCDGGNLRRRDALECPVSTLEPDTCCEPECGEGFFCSDAGEVACGCVPLCHTDADCQPTELCLCGSQGGQCVPAGCQTGADCDPGQECTSWDTSQGCLYPAFECTTPADTCGGDLDCTAAGEYCVVQPDGHRECQPGGCAIGRPFLVDEAARTAPLEVRGDWAQGVAAITDHDEALRARLAEAWEQVAAMEHASIAAFARFALQLLALGAPPDLIVRTHDAMRDETRHARLAFGLASAYRGAPIGPGRLAMDGAVLGEVDVAELVRLTIREGCVGETVAALEAGEGEAACEDPGVRDVLGVIAADERAHAELAWSAVRWALETFGDDVRGTVEAEIRLVERELHASRDLAPVHEDDRLLARHGVTTPTARARLRREALRKVVLPCLRGLARGAPRLGVGADAGVDASMGDHANATA